MINGNIKFSSQLLFLEKGWIVKADGNVLCPFVDLQKVSKLKCSSKFVLI